MPDNNHAEDRSQNGSNSLLGTQSLSLAAYCLHLQVLNQNFGG